MPDKVGKATNRVPSVPLRLRNPLISQDDGGSKGYRGAKWRNAAARAVWLAKSRSSVSSLGPNTDGTGLGVDHIVPYRLGGGNQQSNLRVVDATNHAKIDNATTFAERPAKRRLRTL